MPSGDTHAIRDWGQSWLEASSNGEMVSAVGVEARFETAIARRDAPVGVGRSVCRYWQCGRPRNRRDPGRALASAGRLVDMHVWS